jgi:carbonic anhydrase/acetyltransferase-like protein (isoleucine patch superfamily)
MMSNIRSFRGNLPQLDSSCYVDESAVVIGRVSLGKDSSIWCNAVLRGDVSYIQIGENTNIQDLTMLHVTHYNQEYSQPEQPLIIGNNVTVGHNCCLHACSIGNNVLVGMGTTILDAAVIHDNVFIGAQSLVPPGKVLQSGYLYLGNPVKRVRELTSEEINFLTYSALHYVKLKNTYLDEL